VADVAFARGTVRVAGVVWVLGRLLASLRFLSAASGCGVWDLEVCDSVLRDLQVAGWEGEDYWVGSLV